MAKKLLTAEEAEAKRLKRNEQCKQYHIKNRERRLAYKRENHAKNKAHRLQKMKEWREKNKERRNVYFKAWWRKNRGSKDDDDSLLEPMFDVFSDDSSNTSCRSTNSLLLLSEVALICMGHAYANVKVEPVSNRAMYYMSFNLVNMVIQTNEA
ncbi:hypothetical protein H310_04526 [Aphanomyces invadans]|uniref:Uncharacterized protein n=1 Tax=Aphanomyces invadans TaxID=157072 RepID=A0A024UE54_9STRA|nr:hypothetical protein H310_04526 [Aphanomyces invadans]ETW04177.1 hypothetical protein H310_04526 [Aphanomyces invadans]|eukprot:XP_008867133.1 hypothetical protein H310_04526 [Aphanomyces invadans]